MGRVWRGPVLDFRELLEAVEEVALVRQPDRYDETLAQTVRVYTVYGREAVFTDEDGWVVGDLPCLRSSHARDTPLPPALPTYEPPNPRPHPCTPHPGEPRIRRCPLLLLLCVAVGSAVDDMCRVVLVAVMSSPV